MSCAICEKRRPRRHCPAVRGEICTQCCGTQRENSILCPNDCQYLLEARLHERETSLDGKVVHRRGIQFSEEILDALIVPISLLSLELRKTAIEAGALDSDVREALDSLIGSYKTFEQSGLIYEGLPANPIAARLYRALKLAAEGFLAHERRDFGARVLTGKDIFTALAFMEVIATQRDNGRKYCRSYIWTLGRLQLQDPAASAGGAGATGEPSLLLP